MTSEQRVAAWSEHAHALMALVNCSRRNDGVDFDYEYNYGPDGSGISRHWHAALHETWSDPMTPASMAERLQGWAADDVDWADVPPGTANSNNPVIPWNDRLRSLTGGIALRPNLPIVTDAPASLLFAADGREAFRLMLIRYRHAMSVPRGLVGRVTHTHAVKRIGSPPLPPPLPVMLVGKLSGASYPLQGEDEPPAQFACSYTQKQITRYMRPIPHPWSEFGWVDYEKPNISASSGTNQVFPTGLSTDDDTTVFWHISNLTQFGRRAYHYARLRVIARDGRSGWKVVGRLKTYWAKTTGNHQAGAVRDPAEPLVFPLTAGLRGESAPVEMVVRPAIPGQSDATTLPDDFCYKDWNGILSLTSPDGDSIPPEQTHEYIRIEAQMQDYPAGTSGKTLGPDGKVYLDNEIERGTNWLWQQQKVSGSVPTPALATWEHTTGNVPGWPAADTINGQPVSIRDPYAIPPGSLGLAQIGQPVTEQTLNEDGSLTVVVTTHYDNSGLAPADIAAGKKAVFLECQEYTRVETDGEVAEREDFADVAMEETPESAAAGGPNATLATPWRVLALTDPTLSTLITEGWCDVDLTTPEDGE
ncbi:hypothetical protein [Geminisphaera colitermitum]|uniref:hypothetical protein n=1 Tax=Geminisphaera colitermitum TaxID=1148786 RepID=UPI0012FE843B|nr:hypothetical protein [Geminisphaera colitermitum]